MKKILFLIIMAVSIALTSCGSTKIALSEHSPVAILGIEGNPKFYSVDDNMETDPDDGGTITNAIGKLLESKDVELMTAQDRVDYAEDYLRYALEEIAGMEVVEKSQVVENKIYKSTVGNVFGFMTLNKSATGYKHNVLSMGAKKARMFMKDINASSLISASFEFDKHRFQKKAGSMISGVVKMNVKFFDNRGSQIISKEYIAESEGIFNAGGYDKDEFVELFPPLIESVINRFVMEYMN